MLHQTLILSSPISFPSVSASPSSSSPHLSLFASNAEPAATATATATTIASAYALLRSSSPAMPSYAHHHSSLDERMDALKGSTRQEESAEEAAAAAEAPAAWGFAEKDEFSVEDLLDLEEFCEGEADAKDDGADEPPLAAVKQEDKSKDVGSQQSVVSFDLAPPAPPAPEIVDLPAHDAEELEWVSRIMDDSLSELPPQPAPPASMMAARPPQHRLLLQPQQRHPHDGAYRALPSLASDPFRTPTICALSTEALVPVKAKRSKRSRASGWSLSGTPHDSASSSSTSSSCSSSSATFSPYFLLDAAQLGGSDLLLGEQYSLLAPAPSKKSKHGKSGKSKKRGRKPKHLPTHPSMMGSPAPGDRRCTHCGVQKTPQWRAGPEGAKTLCNACGVRYKSGRLLPEYRPACSPTYVSTVHSNSHRKVLEMRRKKEDGPMAPMYFTAAPHAPAPAAAPAVPSF